MAREGLLDVPQGAVADDPSVSVSNEPDAAFAAARAFRPLSDEERTDFRRWAVGARRDKGPCWWNPDPKA